MPKREPGYRRIDLERPGDPLSEGISEEPPIFRYHEGTVVKLPSGIGKPLVNRLQNVELTFTVGE